MDFLLQAHSGWRWVVLILVIIVTAKSLFGWLTKQDWSRLDTNLLLYARIAVYIQVVLGVILYIMVQGWTHMRFTGEHVIVALLAVGAIEFGAGRAKRKKKAIDIYKFVFIGFVIALILIFVAISGASTFGQG